MEGSSLRKSETHCRCSSGGGGRVLSPYLFAIFVDDILIKLKKSKLGCHVKSLIINAIMYADDLMLLAISLTDLQRMVNICVDEFRSHGYTININKSGSLLIGQQHAITLNNITIDNQEIPWKGEINFLGVTLCSANSFKINLQKVRQKFFRAANGIFCKIGNKSELNVTLSLLQAFCVPLLSYGIEWLSITKTIYNKLESAYAAIFAKVFGVSDKNVILNCQYFSGYLPFSDLLDLKKIKFMDGVKTSENYSLKLLFNILNRSEYLALLEKYKLCSGNSKSCK